MESYGDFVAASFAAYDRFLFIGAMGICVRCIAPCVSSKYADPAVVCMDSTGQFVVPVLSGHVGGANEWAKQISSIIGAQAVITTQSDCNGVWALDLLASKFGWQTACTHEEMKRAIARFVNQERVALLLDIKDKGTAWLERTLPPYVKVYYHYEDIPFEETDLLIAVTPYEYEAPVQALYYRPQVLHLGVGCKKQCVPDGVAEYIEDSLKAHHLSPLSLATISTIALKKDEPLLKALQDKWPQTKVCIYSSEELSGMEIPNPSQKVYEVTGVYGVAESAACKSSGCGKWLVEKQKGELTPGSHFTFAVTLEANAVRGGHIEIVGAGPGDPELISVRGKQMLEKADLVLYAGSLVPRELTYYAKEGAGGTQFGSHGFAGTVCPDERVLRQGTVRGPTSYRRSVYLWSHPGTDGFLRCLRHELSHHAGNLFFPSCCCCFAFAVYHTGKSAERYPDPWRGKNPYARERAVAQAGPVTKYHVYLPECFHCGGRAARIAAGLSAGDSCGCLLQTDMEGRKDIPGRTEGFGTYRT